jgi:hypothetical protein
MTVMMLRGMGLVVAGVLFSAAAGAAHAAGKTPPVDFTVRSETSQVANSAYKTLKWDARKGRWGVTLNLDQSDARPTKGNDVQAGAYYHITPSLRVGGAVAFGDEQVKPGPNKIGSEAAQPRVRLESSFKF